MIGISSWLFVGMKVTVRAVKTYQVIAATNSQVMYHNLL
jgi:hypothetical protein